MMLENEDLDKAFNKELFIIRNDLYYQQLELDNNGKKEIWRLDIAYKPLQALSGDSYSLRKTKDGRVVGFIVDAMGKGISAALTSMAATRFLNYIFEELEDEGSFDYALLIKKFIKFMAQNLMEEEMLSIALFELDIHHSVLHYALCGMPAFLMVIDNDERIIIKSNNPPVMRYTDNLNIETMKAFNIHKMLCYSDGLSESIVLGDIAYNKQMRQDFFESTCVKEFNAFANTVINNADDDITYFYIQKSDKLESEKKLSILSSYEAIEEALHTISIYLREQRVSHKCASEIILTFSELLLNALEHGSFGISREVKNALIAQNLFDEKMIDMETQYKDKLIEVPYKVISKKHGMMFEATISDSGDGFDVQTLKNIVVNADNYNGR
ncbi:MAG: SpoIIE family protein phosphatase, partial [Sulfurospirillaceae bacterium]|nr:SpoIIE family protein phosphatase [Sulfurospirillaceae bacterium]